MKLSRSKPMFNIFTLFTLLAMLIGIIPASPVQAEAPARPLLASGDFVWAKGIGGMGLIDNVGRDITIDSSGNIYTTGGYYSTADFDPGPGISNLTSTGNGDIFVTKLDSSGNILWAKSMGGVNYDFGYSIAVDSSGDVYTTGSFEGTADFDPGPGTFNLTSTVNGNIFVTKLDSSGNFVWAKSMSGMSSGEGQDIALGSNSNVYTTGYFSGTVDFDPGAGTYNLTSAGDSDIFVSKLDSNGDFVWAKSMGGINVGWMSNDHGNSIAVDASGNVYTTGYFEGTADFDPSAGTYNLTSISGSYDIFVSKLDGNGNFVWARDMGGTIYDFGDGIAVDSNGNVYITGTFFGTADFDPGVGSFNLTSVGNNDIFVSKLDSNGDFIWAKGMGGTNFDGGHSITLDSSANVYTTGGFSGIADFDPGAGISDLTSGSLGMKSAISETKYFLIERNDGCMLRNHQGHDV